MCVFMKAVRIFINTFAVFARPRSGTLMALRNAAFTLVAPCSRQLVGLQLHPKQPRTVSARPGSSRGEY